MEGPDIKAFLEELIPEQDWDSEHLKRTPERFANMLRDMTVAEESAFDFTVFKDADNINELVAINDIPFYTFCAHHIIPFFGVAHIGYVPKGKIAGLSKFARAVTFFAKGLWVQEQLTVQ